MGMTNLPPDFITEWDAMKRRLAVLETNNRPAFQKTIAAEESRTSTSYGLMATPDQVQGVVLPTKGLIFVGYQALMKETVANFSEAAIFINGNQIQIQAVGQPIPIAAPVARVNANDGASVNIYKPIATENTGMGNASNATSVESGADVTTGQVLGAANDQGGVCTIFADPGVYDVSVRFKAGSGTVTVKNRQLWVWTMGFFGR